MNGILAFVDLLCVGCVRAGYHGNLATHRNMRPLNVAAKRFNLCRIMEPMRLRHALSFFALGAAVMVGACGDPRRDHSPRQRREREHRVELDEPGRLDRGGDAVRRRARRRRDAGRVRRVPRCAARGVRRRRPQPR